MTGMLNALLTHDLTTLSQPNMVWGMCGILFMVIFLESALLPAAFLPGDSMLLLAGALTAKGILPFLPTMGLLIAAAGGGYWLNFLLGRWLGHTRLVQKWLTRMPEHYHQRAYLLSKRYGALALIMGRFLGFIRTLLPLLAGISGLSQRKFQLFSWLSALLWVYALMAVGRSLTDIPFFRQNEAIGMASLLILPLFLLIAGVIGGIIVIYRRKKIRGNT